MSRMRLGEIAHARSGDKGNHANLGVIAYQPAGSAFLERELTAEVVQKYFQSLQPSQVTRYSLPGIGGYNFLLTDVLDGGASRSLRVDSQGKTLGVAILDLELPRPDDWQRMLPADLPPLDEDLLPRIPGGWAEQAYQLGTREFRLWQPASPDSFLDDPEVSTEHQRDGYMPYWSYLWPTSLDMAAVLLSEKFPTGTEALELGCGIGLAGLAGLAAGLRVTFSDYDVQAVRLALTNARKNGFSARGCFLDWREPPATQYPLVLGCDVVYERVNHQPIVAALEKLLTPGGVAWMADPGRHQADEFIALAKQAGFGITRRELPRQPYPGRPDGTTQLWILQR